MREVNADLWSLLDPKGHTAICVTTNGFVKKNGNAVMGRGCALEATKQFPGIDEVLGRFLTAYGNHVHRLHENPDIFSFPVKHNWNEVADLDLIKQSLHELWWRMKTDSYKSVYLPRPGCGNGQLSWSAVKPLVEEKFGNDDRLVIVDFANVAKEGDAPFQSLTVEQLWSLRNIALKAKEQGLKKIEVDTRLMLLVAEKLSSIEIPA